MSGPSQPPLGSPPQGFVASSGTASALAAGGTIGAGAIAAGSILAGTDGNDLGSSSEQFDVFANYVALGGGSASIYRAAANIIALGTGAASGEGFLASQAGHKVIPDGGQITNATTTFASITGLSRDLHSGRYYQFECCLFFTNSVAADGAKFDFGGTFGTSIYRAHGLIFDAALLQSLQVTMQASAHSAAVTTGASMFICRGHLSAADDSGTFFPRFAKNSHTTGTLSLHEGSYLKVTDMPG